MASPDFLLAESLEEFSSSFLFHFQFITTGLEIVFLFQICLMICVLHCFYITFINIASL